MRSCHLAVSFIILLCGHAIAGNSDSICKIIADRDRSPGLYIAYPHPEGEVDLRPVRGKMPYSATARFYFASPFKFRIERLSGEGVWLVKMQTSSQGQEATDTALVYRPPARTRCNPDVPLSAFDENDRFYPLWKYNQYHDTSRGVASDPALHKSFHLRIKDVMSKGADGCAATDNWQACLLYTSDAADE